MRPDINTMEGKMMRQENTSAVKLAHIAEDGREQSVWAHLTGTAQKAADFARPFGAQEQAELAGLAHDIGKYSDAFQRRLHGDPKKVDHATAGAYACFARNQPCAAFAVLGHHGGLPDGGGDKDSPEASTFWGRIKRAEKGLLPPCDGWERDVTLPNPEFPNAMRDLAEGMFYIRMLYSCLVDADFLDTETFMSGEARPENETDMDALWRRFQDYIGGWFPPKGELNAQRCAILERCMNEGARREPGLFTLTVPTGGGKTVASLAFALAHTKAHGLRRIIYVIPYTSIIEQTAATFREILGEDAVLEHHSNVQYDMDEREEATPESIRMARATENWDMPVIVTTAVQFFESLFACRPSQCRKLHSIAGSVVIFDEAQMLPLPYLRPCVYAISQLVKNYRVSAVLCTATQPALEPIFQEEGFLPERSMAELCPPETFQWEAFRRVQFRQAGRLTWDELAEQLNNCRQALCVVNARISAQTLFSRLKGEGRFHLSTLMYPAHRQAQLAEIRQRLAAGLPCRVVSTSLIEAGVDVDFPAVWREEAGLDSVLQAAGRCNREGKRPAAQSLVTVFQGEDKPPKLFKTAIGVGHSVMAKQADIAAPEAIRAYFHELLELKGCEAQDQKHILDTIRNSLFPFRTVAEAFQLIESPTHTVYIPDGEGAELVERLRAGEHSRRLFRKLGRYGVEVYDGPFRELLNANDVELLEDGSAVLINPKLYDVHTGLSLKAEEGKGYLL